MIKREVIAKTLSKGFAEALDTVVIDAGGELSFTRRQMIEDLDCGNFNAAARLSKVLRRLGIHTVAKLYRTDPQSLLRARGVGEATVYVAMCILDARKYDVYKWWGWKQDNVVKFAAYRAQAKSKAKKYKHAV